MLLFTAAMATSCRTTTEAPKPEATSQRREVSWQDAKRVLEDEPVDMVGISHSRGLFFILRGEHYSTTVPDLAGVDWVWNTMERRRRSGDQIDFVAE